MSLLRRSSWRHFARHPAQLALAVLGIALGVAVVLAVDLANASAERAFALSTESLVGRATHRVSGGSAGLADDDYRRLRVELGLRHAAPGLSSTARAITADGRRTVTLLGVDPFAEASLRPWLAFDGEAGDLDVARLLVQPGAVAATAAAATRLGLEVGQRLPIELRGFRREVELVGLLGTPDEPTARGLDDVLIADLATAQELLERIGEIETIDLRLDGDPATVSALVDRIEAALPAHAHVETTGASRGHLRDLTRAFRINLQALSLLALLVGAFLIFNAVQFAVVQRRALIGTLRAVGATRGQIFRTVLLEAAGLGALGTLLGLLLGPWLGAGLVGLVARTINDLYFTLAVTSVAMPPGTFAVALLLGLSVCLVAALPPALEATRVPPREAMLRSSLEQRFRRALPRTVLWAGGLASLAAVLLRLPSRGLLPAYAGLLAVLLAAACLVPLCCVLLLGLARPPLRALFGAAGSQAARGASTTLSRTAVATAALMLAVAASVGLGAMIGSFRDSVSTWLQTALRADVYVTVATTLAERDQAEITPPLVELLTQADGVANSSTYRRFDVPARLPQSAGETPLQLVALQTSPPILSSFELVDGELARLRSPGTVIISEPLAYRHRLAVGDTFEVRADRGWLALEVVAVFVDFGSERGVAMIDRDATHRRHWRDRGVSSLALFAAPGVDAGALALRLDQAVATSDSSQVLSIRSNHDLRATSLQIFDRTFAITGALRLLCLAVAFLGIWSALMALQLDRRREIGVLRALGALPRQVATLVLAQTGLLGLCAGLIAVPVGALLGWLLVTVINRRSFGWTLLETRLPAGVVVEALLVAVAAALLAGLYPAWRFARTVPAQALREDG